MSNEPRKHPELGYYDLIVTRGTLMSFLAPSEAEARAQVYKKNLSYVIACMGEDACQIGFDISLKSVRDVALDEDGEIID